MNIENIKIFNTGNCGEVIIKKSQSEVERYAESDSLYEEYLAFLALIERCDIATDTLYFFREMAEIANDFSKYAKAEEAKKAMEKKAEELGTSPELIKYAVKVVRGSADGCQRFPQEMLEALKKLITEMTQEIEDLEKRHTLPFRLAHCPDDLVVIHNEKKKEIEISYEKKKDQKTMDITQSLLLEKFFKWDEQRELWSGKLTYAVTRIVRAVVLCLQDQKLREKLARRQGW